MAVAAAAIVVANTRRHSLAPLTNTRWAAPFGGPHLVIDSCLVHLARAAIRHVHVISHTSDHTLRKHLAAAWTATPQLTVSVTAHPDNQPPNRVLRQALQNLPCHHATTVIVTAPPLLTGMDYRRLIAAHDAEPGRLSTAAVAPVATACTPVRWPTPTNAHPAQNQSAENHPAQSQSDQNQSTETQPVDNHQACTTHPAGSATPAEPSPWRRIGSYAVDTATVNALAHRDDAPAALAAVTSPEATEYAVTTDSSWFPLHTIDDYFSAHQGLLGHTPPLQLPATPTERARPAKLASPTELARSTELARASEMTTPANQTEPANKNEPARPIDVTTSAAPTGHQAEPAESQAAMITHGWQGQPSTTGDVIISPATVITGGTIHQSVLGSGVRVHTGAVISTTIMADDVSVGRHAIISNAIIGAGTRIPDHTNIGVDRNHDRARGLHITPGGLTIVPPHIVLPESGLTNRQDAGTTPNLSSWDTVSSGC